MPADGEEAAALLLPVTQEYFSMPYLSKQHGGKWLGEGDLAQKLRELAQQLTSHLDPEAFPAGFPCTPLRYHWHLGCPLAMHAVGFIHLI